MKRRIAWLLVAAAVLIIATVGWRGWKARETVRQQEQTALVKEPVLELSALDVAKVGVKNISLGIPISGSLKAVNSAVVKARVAGELQGLALREGDKVTAGQVIARVESSEYANRVRQAEQQADAARAEVDIAQRQYDNNAALVKQGFISQTALDTSLAKLNATKASHRATLAAADIARKSVADTVLRAPIDGQISQRLAQPGERVAPEARIVEIVDLSQLELEAALSPADSVAVRVGQTADLTIEGVAQPVVARVARINPATQAGSRNVLVYLSLQSTPGLRQGLFAQGLLSTERKSALAVPLSSVRTDKPLPYVQVVENGRVVHHNVEIGARGAVDGDTVVAVKGLTEGALVLRGAAGALREGTAVRLAAGVQP